MESIKKRGRTEPGDEIHPHNTNGFMGKIKNQCGRFAVIISDFSYLNWNTLRWINWGQLLM